MLRGKENLLPRVLDVKTCPEFHLLVTFKNGEKKFFDMKPLLTLPAYRNLPKVFNDVRVEYGTAVWPGDIDISPETLYLEGKPA